MDRRPVLFYVKASDAIVREDDSDRAVIDPLKAKTTTFEALRKIPPSGRITITFLPEIMMARKITVVDLPPINF